MCHYQILFSARFLIIKRSIIDRLVRDSGLIIKLTSINSIFLLRKINSNINMINIEAT